MVVGACLWMPLRIFGLLLPLFMNIGLISSIVGAGLKANQPVAQWRVRLLSLIARTLWYPWFCLATGLTYKVHRPEVDYSYWLGPDYKKDVEKRGGKPAPTAVQNHSNLLDSMIFMAKDECRAHTAASSNVNIPGCGALLKTVQSIFIKRLEGKVELKDKAA